MVDLIVFEDAGWADLLPLTWWRAAFELRCGIDPLLAKIERACGAAAGLFVRPELAETIAERYAGRAVNAVSATRPALVVNGRMLFRGRDGGGSMSADPPDLPLGSAAWSADGRTLLAAHVQSAYVNRLAPEALLDAERTRAWLGGTAEAAIPEESYELIAYPWHLVAANGTELERDIRARTVGKPSEGGFRRPERNVLVEGDHPVALGRGARIRAGAVLVAERGPILIDEEAVVSPNATIQGPCYVGPRSQIQPGAVIREATSIGPRCKVGGEVEGTIFQGYSNKQHLGFLGHAFVGEWVNLGAGTVNSDLKNTYGTVRVRTARGTVDTGHMFVGAFIGDHAKTGINVALPTGALIGFAAQVLADRPPNYVPSFTWLTDDGPARCDPSRAVEVARKVMGRREVELTAAGARLFLGIAAAAERMES